MKYTLPVLFLLLTIGVNAQKGVPEDFCLTDDEYRLYELINAHRLENELKEIPLSASLSFVARTHVVDLYTNHPDTSICNLNSWSDKGDWSACCHNKYIPKEDCIRNKPRELSNYSGDGYELTYAEIFNTHPDTVFKFWKKIDEANEFMLNRGSWEDKTWKALGVAIYKNYAVIWMGQRSDPSAIPEPCSVVTEKKAREEREDIASGNIEVISGSTGRFYIIVASFPSLADARTEAGKYADLSSKNIIILINKQGQYRISINDYPSLDAAKKGKANYVERFKEAWIIQY